MYSIDEITHDWPRPFVFRHLVKQLSNFPYSPGYLANLDSVGNGPIGRFMVGKFTAYPTESLGEWLMRKSSKNT